MMRLTIFKYDILYHHAGSMAGSMLGFHGLIVAIISYFGDVLKKYGDKLLCL